MIAAYIIVTGLLFLISVAIAWQDEEPITLMAHALIVGWALWLLVVEL